MRPDTTAGQRHSPQRGFTLVELLVVIAIIGILASLFLGGLFSAEEQAKIQRTKATIAKINNVVMARWDSYRTRRVPIDVTVASGAADYSALTAGLSLAKAAGWRLDGLRELMRLEMPNTWTDVNTNPDPNPPAGRPTLAMPSLAWNYQAKWTYYQSTYKINNPAANQSIIDSYDAAETLYMICMVASPDELDPRNNFSAQEVGDVDRDGAPEFLDAWGMPIIFIRWAPGFTSELQTGLDPDPYDPRFVYPSAANPQLNASGGGSNQNVYSQASVQTNPTFALYPLILSAGPDKAYDIIVPADASPPNGVAYSDTWPSNQIYQLNDPFNSLFTSPRSNNPHGTIDTGPNGLQCDTNQNGVYEYFDNIHNHMLDTKR